MNKHRHRPRAVRADQLIRVTRAGPAPEVTLTRSPVRNSLEVPALDHGHGTAVIKLDGDFHAGGSAAGGGIADRRACSGATDRPRSGRGRRRRCCPQGRGTAPVAVPTLLPSVMVMVTSAHPSDGAGAHGLLGTDFAAVEGVGALVGGATGNGGDAGTAGELVTMAWRFIYFSRKWQEGQQCGLGPRQPGHCLPQKRSLDRRDGAEAVAA